MPLRTNNEQPTYSSYCSTTEQAIESTESQDFLKLLAVVVMQPLKAIARQASDSFDRQQSSS